MVAFPALNHSNAPHSLIQSEGKRHIGAVAVFGLGVSGLAVARWAGDGAGGRVTSLALIDVGDGERLRAASDEIVREASLPVTCHFGDEIENVTAAFQLGVISPGIAPGTAVWNLAHERCAEVISEVELAFRESTHRWIAITGTNGKTTTTSLVTHVLNHAGVPAVSVGNIGYPALEAALTVPADTVLVAEVSSFQLSTTARFHPEAAAVVNITPDHLNWHGTMEAYALDKMKVYANLNRDDLALYFGDDEFSAECVAVSGLDTLAPWRVSLNAESAAPVLTWWGAPSSPSLGVRTTEGEERWCNAADLAIKGSHNWANALFAGAIARYWGLAPSDIESGLVSFAPVEHRLEHVGTVGGVDYYNDSKATNPDATMKAVDSFPGRAVHLLVGGRPKGSDFHDLASYARDKAATAICFGEAQHELAHAFLDEWGAAGDRVRWVDTMLDALSSASGSATPGDIVLLSPACASFDEFSGYEERGRVFAGAVARLTARAGDHGA